MVALAQKFLMALWRFLETGEFPAGAVLTAEASGEPAPGGAQVQRTRATVVGWGGALVAGHGCVERTEEEEGGPTPGLQRRRERRQERGCGRA